MMKTAIAPEIDISDYEQMMDDGVTGSDELANQSAVEVSKDQEQISQEKQYLQLFEAMDVGMQALTPYELRKKQGVDREAMLSDYDNMVQQDRNLSQKDQDSQSEGQKRREKEEARFDQLKEGLNFFFEKLQNGELSQVFADKTDYLSFAKRAIDFLRFYGYQGGEEIDNLDFAQVKQAIDNVNFDYYVENLILTQPKSSENETARESNSQNTEMATEQAEADSEKHATELMQAAESLSQVVENPTELNQVQLDREKLVADKMEKMLAELTILIADFRSSGRVNHELATQLSQEMAVQLPEMIDKMNELPQVESQLNVLMSWLTSGKWDEFTGRAGLGEMTKNYFDQLARLRMEDEAKEHFNREFSQMGEFDKFWANRIGSINNEQLKTFTQLANEAINDDSYGIDVPL